MRILIAEDEVSIAKALKIMLEKNNFTVDMVHDGGAALDYLNACRYDTAVLDIMMPGMDGLEVLRRARMAGNDVPVLLLTAKGEVEDRVAGLEAGADDYLPKPFASSEFVARVKALSRRRGGYSPARLTCGNTTLDCNQYTLSAGGESVRLNNKEFQLMELLFRNPRHVFSSEHLMDRIWGADATANIDVIWTYIGFLRRKLRQVASNLELRTIRGAGYMLEVPPC